MFDLNVLIARIKEHWKIALPLVLVAAFLMPMVIASIIGVVTALIMAPKWYPQIKGKIGDCLSSGSRFVKPNDMALLFIFILTWMIMSVIVSIVLSFILLIIPDSQTVIIFILQAIITMSSMVIGHFAATTGLGLYSLSGSTQPVQPKKPIQSRSRSTGKPSSGRKAKIINFNKKG